MMISQMALQMAQQSPPGMFNLEALNRTILSAANLPNLEQILPPKKEPQQLDPVSDIMAATKGIPIAAFPGQNHDAHIQVKMTYLQDPANGANPIMQRIKPVLESNIQEHSVLKYQEQMSGVTEQMSSVEIPMGRCVGDCESKDEHRLAGLIDNYIGIEPSDPSIQLLSSVPLICPLGVQQGFDHFVDNRCFVHTFSDIIDSDNCPIRTMILDICIQVTELPAAF